MATDNKKQPPAKKTEADPDSKKPLTPQEGTEENHPTGKASADPDSTAAETNTESSEMINNTGEDLKYTSQGDADAASG
jgi:hypothetical protein